MSEVSSRLKIIVMLAAVSLAVRLLLLGGPELLPEEAYYWNYAAHPALGYLDHPPLSAWLTIGSMALFGESELAVRVPSLVCGLLSAWLVYIFVRRVSNVRIALSSVAIFSCLPYFLANSFYLSPDAALVPAWIASLYLFVRIIEEGTASTRQWILWATLGIVIGLGMLAKYTMCLPAAAAVCVMLYDPTLRTWFRRPHPYVAAALAAAVFSPVLYWNATHEWASIAFQTSGRLADSPRFALPAFIGNLLVLATPLGVLVLGLYAVGRIVKTFYTVGRMSILFLDLTFLIPTMLFAFFSIRHQTRLHWGGPGLVAMLPVFSAHFLGVAPAGVRWNRWLEKSWSIVLAISVAAFGLFWLYGGPSLPGLGYSKKWSKLFGWEDLGLEVTKRVNEMSATRPVPAFVLGMDKHYTAAELAFYVRPAAQKLEVPVPDVAGRAVVGIESLMFNYWRPERSLTGRDALLVTRNKSDLEAEEVVAAFERLGEIVEYRALRNEKLAGIYYYRPAFGFRAPPDIEGHRMKKID